MEAHHPSDSRSYHPQALPGAFFMNSITQTTPVTSAPAALPPLTTCTVAVIGLGYVGLPLAAAFATPAACVRTAAPLRRRVIGFDINGQRLAELREGHDRTRETNQQEL